MQPLSINDRIEKIKDDEEEVNKLIEEYKPFIASCTQKTVGRYIRYGEDDELSIALMAFAESIKSYEKTKGNFLSFAQNVIKRRLIDYYRKEKKHNNVISLNEYSDNDEYSDENERENDLSIEKSMDIYKANEISEYRRLELLQLKEELSKWGITFSDLVESSPKHRKTRKLCSDVVRFILSRTDLVSILMSKKKLPTLEIEKHLKIPRKKIERARKYIITVVIILTGDYQYIKDYVNWEGIE